MAKMPFGLKIAIISREFRKKLDEKAASMGLTSVQLRVLGSVSRLEAAGKREIHQNDLERIEHVTHPAMTKLIKKLESKGFVSCSSDANDKRCKLISSTPKSEGIHKAIIEHDEAVLEELCKDFSQEQKKALLSSIDMLIDNIDSQNY